MIDIPVALPPPPTREATFVGAGDIADCLGASEATALLLDRIGGWVFTLGDNVYPSATAHNFGKCYQPTWGRHLGRTYPSVGNHDEWNENGSYLPYFDYFGPAAGLRGRGYYSFDLEGWHILSLNSNVRASPGSAQYAWVSRDLQTATGLCSLAYWHYPVFSSGGHGGIRDMREMWRLLDSAGVDIVLAAHDHNYERFATQNADGRPDADGIRQFVVGTGGAPLRRIASVQPNSEVRQTGTHGVLKLTLRSTSYDWEFVPVYGATFRDTGTGQCVR